MRQRLRLEDLAVVVVLVISIVLLILGQPELAVALTLLIVPLILLVKWYNNR